jgi:4-alpha-glucanotransferase
MGEQKFRQYLFFRQWRALKDYCNGFGVSVMGDLPCYVHHDSADVWGNPSLFKLDEKGNPSFVSGVPPDYFSRTGQLWGNPVYDWGALRKSRYAWWVSRVRHNLKLFDLVRIDHFRGLVAYWEVPAKNRTAARGKWVPAPAGDFFHAITKKVPQSALVAEDLGFITPDVRSILDRYGFPGMRVLLFAFDSGGGSQHHAPHSYVKRDYAYTGTHDNNTIRGWYREELSPESRKKIEDYIGKRVTERNIHWDLIRILMMSTAKSVVFPVQDILGLGSEARMNRPATVSGNWKWRLAPGILTRSVENKLKSLTEISGRD